MSSFDSPERINKTSPTISFTENIKIKEEPESMESFCTPKKKSPFDSTGSQIISDSDSESPKCKSESPQSKSRPTSISEKESLEPDIKLDLKPLGLDEKLDPWIQMMKNKSAVTSMPLLKNQIQQRQQIIKEIELQVLDKISTAFSQIPSLLLESLPGFNLKTYQELKILRQHLKAKTRLMEKKLEQLSQEEESSAQLSRHDETLSDESFSQKPPSPLRHNLNQSPIITQPISNSSKLMSSNKFRNGESEKINSPKDIWPNKIVDCESPNAAKKSSFQVKKPVRATIPLATKNHTLKALDKVQPVHAGDKFQTSNKNDIQSVATISYFSSPANHNTSSQESSTQKSTSSAKFLNLNDSWEQMNNSFGLYTC